MLDLPRHVIAKRLSGGHLSFYFAIPTVYRRAGCTIPNEPLGDDYGRMVERASALNGLFDEWRAGKAAPTAPGAPRFGTVGWLFREYKASEHYRLRVSARTRPDYDRTMAIVPDFPPKRGAKLGPRPVGSITPRAADKLVKLLAIGKRGPRPRQVEKVRAVCRHAWRVVHRLYPDVFDVGIPNPWVGVTLPTRAHATKAAVDREAVYSFAWKAIEAGHPEPAAAAVIAFEWLQRPENIIGGHVTWPGYRGGAAPDQIRILHHKTGAVVLHPLSDPTTGELFYADAEAVLARLPRRGVPMVL